MASSDGVLVDTWFWDYRGPETVGSLRHPDEPVDADDDAGDRRVLLNKRLAAPQKVAIEVRLVKKADSDSPAPRAVLGARFRVGVKALKLWVDGTDIECLRTAIFGLLEKRFEVKWEPYLLIRIGSASAFHSGRETGLSLAEANVYRGVAPDGTELLRELTRYGGSRDWQYRVWPGEYTDEDGVVVACIPATEVNRKAIKEFHGRIDALRERLADLVMPENVMATLANLSQTTALPAPVQRADDE